MILWTGRRIAPFRIYKIAGFYIELHGVTFWVVDVQCGLARLVTSQLGMPQLQPIRHLDSLCVQSCRSERISTAPVCIRLVFEPYDTHARFFVAGRLGKGHVVLHYRGWGCPNY